MCEKDETPKMQSALDDLVNEFMECYAPAADWTSADLHMTSAELAGMFNSVYPVPLEKIYEALMANGFRCVPLPGQTAFVWLLSINRESQTPDNRS